MVYMEKEYWEETNKQINKPPTPTPPEIAGLEHHHKIHCI